MKGNSRHPHNIDIQIQSTNRDSSTRYNNQDIEQSSSMKSKQVNQSIQPLQYSNDHSISHFNHPQQSSFSTVNNSKDERPKPSEG